jgi:hypothetical protein
MKNLLIIICCSLSLNAQTEKVGQLFNLKANTNAVFIQKMLGISNNEIKTNDTIMVEQNVMFVVQSITPTSVFFYAKDFSELSNSDSKYKTNKDKSFYYNDLLFSMKIEDYKVNAVDASFPDNIVLGLITLPYKLRPQNNTSFDSEFNLNASLGVLVFGKFFGNTKLYIQAGSGLGSVSLNTSNAPGLNADQAQNVSCFTAFSGLMVQYKDVQAGFYFGGDWIKNNSKYNWESQGKSWISLGIGFKVFTLAKKTGQ